MKFKTEGEQIYTTDFWYDLMDGGYIRPEDLLTSQDDIDMVTEALDVIQTFRTALVSSGTVEII